MKTTDPYMLMYLEHHAHRRLEAYGQSEDFCFKYKNIFVSTKEIATSVIRNYNVSFKRRMGKKSLGDKKPENILTVLPMTPCLQVSNQNSKTHFASS